MSEVDEYDRISRYSPEGMVGTSRDEGRSNKVYPMMGDEVVSSANSLEMRERHRGGAEEGELGTSEDPG